MSDAQSKFLCRVAYLKPLDTEKSLLLNRQAETDLTSTL